MKVNTELRDQILEVVNNQLKSNDPKETRITFKRLIKEGFSESDAKKLLGQCVLLEMYSVLKDGKPFNQARFIKNLNQLPKEPND
ncbi:MAG: hypothetical protein ACXWCZ_03025 [Flavisolibacter sp.]